MIEGRIEDEETFFLFIFLNREVITLYLLFVSFIYPCVYMSIYSFIKVHIHFS